MTSYNWFLRNELRVDDLINLEGATEKSYLIRNIFNDRDKEIIMKIPLTSSMSEDVYVWHYTSNGEFTVRLASQVGVNFMDRSNGESAGSSLGSNGIWKNFGNLKYPKN